MGAEGEREGGDVVQLGEGGLAGHRWRHGPGDPTHPKSVKANVSKNHQTETPSEEMVVQTVSWRSARKVPSRRCGHPRGTRSEHGVIRRAEFRLDALRLTPFGDC